MHEDYLSLPLLVTSKWSLFLDEFLGPLLELKQNAQNSLLIKMAIKDLSKKHIYIIQSNQLHVLACSKAIGRLHTRITRIKQQL